MNCMFLYSAAVLRKLAEQGPCSWSYCPAEVPSTGGSGHLLLLFSGCPYGIPESQVDTSPCILILIPVRLAAFFFLILCKKWELKLRDVQKQIQDQAGERQCLTPKAIPFPLYHTGSQLCLPEDTCKYLETAWMVTTEGGAARFQGAQTRQAPRPLLLSLTSLLRNSRNIRRFLVPIVILFPRSQR